MNGRRLLLLIASIALSAALAIALRNAVHDFLVVPLAYVAWQIAVLMGAVPEFARWLVLVVALGLLLAWQLVPDLRPASRLPARPREGMGPVETAATWLLRARASNYFKWQLAHRLGRVSRRLDELRGRKNGSAAASAAVVDYLAAGLDHSFADFPGPRGPFAYPSATPLDLDPAKVIEYLESQSFMNRESHADSL